MDCAAANFKIDAIVGDHTGKSLDNSAQLYGILCRSIQNRSLSCLRNLCSPIVVYDYRLIIMRNCKNVK